MRTIAAAGAVGALLAIAPAMAQSSFEPLEVGDVDMTFLLNYYDQDGDNSPVTGGIGTEDLQVAAPVVVLGWRASETWTLKVDLGVDNITSASTDNIDDVVSSASKKDNRVYTRFSGTRSFGDNQLTLRTGFSNEYDYQSVTAGLGWSRSFHEGNTTFSASVNGFFDTVELYGIDGEVQGEADRDTVDVSLSLSQILGRRTIGSIELSTSLQDGYLATPFHEVILRPTDELVLLANITERLPDSRRRHALGLRLNHAFSKKLIQHAYYRVYDDDWGIQAHTVELETHFRLPTESEMWLFPILRFHTQDASDYFGPPGTFTGDEPFLTADHDLSEFDSEKIGLGYRVLLAPRPTGWRRVFRSWETRLSYYERDNGLESTQLSFAFGWRF